ncbi:S1C family serine protease [Pseudoalteromonas sp. SG44-8]|uniref:S1C family serine protease n=1 Tax=Pseudoalteromonas sp. SG44-8 TaxID=2760958 RepID=UPI001602DD07|nr:serine protease [Pseudoalteromonas sp. SG44-8]MBB1398098.1 trypsin-like peptidase domain-containing protein [Pseudoalteromonas sp. SG44-8]
MKKILPLAIGISILLTGCNSTPNYRKVSESEITNLQSQITDFQAGDYAVTWVQPINKTEKCEMLIEGYSGEPITSTYEWDGNCKGGKAEGLGKISVTNGSVRGFEITYHNKGITDQLYYQWVEGTNNVDFGTYVRENDKMTKKLLNFASLKPNGDIDSVYLQGEKSLTTEIFTGIGRKNYADGFAKLSGQTGNLRFFGAREFFDKNNQPAYTTWGFYDMNADKPDKYIVVKNKHGVFHQKWQFGTHKENVTLPESYTDETLKVSIQASTLANRANSAGQLALAMKQRYDSQNVTSSTVTTKPDNKKPESPKGISTGTGFFISNDGYVLTNSHVIEGSSSISIILNGKSVSATLVDHDSSNDIALLKVDEAVEGLPIELKKKTKQGTEIAVLGYPNIGLQGNEQKATFGYINANSGIQGDTRYFQIDSPIQPGNSGSPMVNDQGVVIGIASASLNQSAAIKATGTLAQNVNYAVKIAYALPMLINHGVDYIEPAKQKTLEKTELIEGISNSVVLVIAE